MFHGLLAVAPAEHSGLSARWRGVAVSGGAVVLALGITVLVGWCLHSQTIERVISGLPVMTALSAIGLSLGGAAALCLSRPRARWAGRALSALMTLLGLVVIFEYVVAPVGVDQLLFRAHGETFPGRPSPQTALAFVLLGGALLTLDLPGRGRWLQRGLLASAAMVVTFAGLGYLFGIVALRGVSHSNGVALHTLCGLAVLTAVTAVLRPDHGLVGLLRGRGSAAIVARASVALGLTPVVIGSALFAMLDAHVLGSRAALSLFTVTMVALIAVIALWLTVRVRRAESGTRELAGQLQALFDNAPVALTLRDDTGRYLQVNHHAAEVLGTVPEELVGRLLAPELTQEQRADDRRIAHSGRSVAHEQLIEHADGSLRDYHLVRYPVLVDGEVRAFGTIGLNISEQKRALTDLRLAQAQFRSTFEEAPIGMMLQALDGTIQQVNPALCRLLARSADDLLHKGVASFLSDQDRFLEASARAELRHLGAPPRTLDLHYERADGRQVPVEAHLTLVRGPEDVPLHYLVQVQDATARRREERRLEFLADHDPLTGLLNRRAFEQALHDRRRHQDDVGAVVIFDLDALKQVNDAHGHHAGDELLVRTASITRAQLRATDVIARLGGDEFAVLLPGTSREAAGHVAHNLLDALNARTDAEGLPVRAIRASVGVAAFGAPISERHDEILQRADMAMYEAKRDGGNRVRVAVAAASAGELDSDVSPRRLRR